MHPCQGIGRWCKPVLLRYLLFVTLLTMPRLPPRPVHVHATTHHWARSSRSGARGRCDDGLPSTAAGCPYRPCLLPPGPAR
eukprot:10709396-Heterocapsa_arctica.AAC.1